MPQEEDPTNSRHTKVCKDAESRWLTGVVSAGYRALIRHHIDRDPRTLDAIAKAMEISPRQFGRILRGDVPLRIEVLAALSDLLGIDQSRAWIAVGQLGDWQRYNDVNLAVIAQLVGPMLEKLETQADFAIEPLTQSAAEQVSEWVAELIISNAEQIRRRRETIEDLPELRRPIRRRRDIDGGA